MYRDVGMAVPKTTETSCRDRAYKHCTNNPIPTSFFHAQCRFPVISEHNQRNMSRTKKTCRDGVICAVFLCPVSTPSFCGFWHYHPYILVHFLENVLFTCIYGPPPHRVTMSLPHTAPLTAESGDVDNDVEPTPAAVCDGGGEEGGREGGGEEGEREGGEEGERERGGEEGGREGGGEEGEREGGREEGGREGGGEEGGREGGGEEGEREGGGEEGEREGGGEEGEREGGEEGEREGGEEGGREGGGEEGEREGGGEARTDNRAPEVRGDTVPLMFMASECTKEL